MNQNSAEFSFGAYLSNVYTTYLTLVEKLLDMNYAFLLKASQFKWRIRLCSILSFKRRKAHREIEVLEPRG